MKKLNAIKNGLFKRNSSLLKYALRTGKSIVFNRDDPKKMLEGVIGKSPDEFISELSVFKGSITKAGQMLSQYAEIYLDEPLKSKLKALQGNTDYLDFEKIKGQLHQVVIKELEIVKDPIAAASIGQVHLAYPKENEEKRYVLKIQYPGISRAIDADMFFLKMLAKAVNIVPKGVDSENVFNEIERILHFEMDYEKEAKTQTQYIERLDDPFFQVPKINFKYSGRTVLCMDFIEGFPLSKIDDYQVSQENKNLYGEKIFDLFLKEIYQFNLIQTDAHGGNFYIANDHKSIFLLDFGACLSFKEETITHYRNFIKFAFKKDREDFFKEINNFLNNWDGKISYDEDIMWEYIEFLTSPLRSVDYSWGDQSFIDQLYSRAKILQETVSITAVPHQFIFLDRKILGIYTLMSALNARFNVRMLLEKYT